MKEIHIILDDLDHMKLVEEKQNRTWRDFILDMLVEVKKK